MANPTHIEPRVPEKRKLSIAQQDDDYIQTDQICLLCGETVYPDGTCDSCEAADHAMTGE